MVDFGTWTLRQGGSKHSIYCQKYAEVSEQQEAGGFGQETQICGGTEREKNVYVSKGNVLKVKFPRISTAGPHFLIKYDGKCLQEVHWTIIMRSIS